ncbi:MAG: pseudouridine synthase [Verrucomicrobiales bacterium]
MRLNRFLATCGFGSRRSCEALILDGHVTVNGEICRALATQVGPTDQVECGGRPAEMPQAITLIVHKPRGLVCTRSDERGRETIYSLLPSRFHGLHHVGRLDKDSEGLILLTNDGDLSQRLTHPSHKIQKEYLVTLDRAPEDADLKQLITGIPTEEGLARAVAYKRTSPRRIRVILQQGLKRQLRHMFEALDFRVKKLVRIRIGGLGIGLVPEGKWQLLDPPMLKALVEAEEIPNWQAEAKPRLHTSASPNRRPTAGRRGESARQRQLAERRRIRTPGSGAQTGGEIRRPPPVRRWVRTLGSQRRQRQR